MVKVLILGLGMAGTTFAVGLERIKKGEIPPYGVPLANVDLGVKISEVEVVGAIDVDARKVGLTAYEVATKLYGMGCAPPSLKEVRVYPGLGAKYVRDLFPTYDEGESWEEQLERVYETFKRLKPHVIIDVTTTQEGKTYVDWAEYEEDVLKGAAAPSQAYAYLALRYAREVAPVAYVNLIPTPVANSPAIVDAAKDVGAVVFGDDGATGATPLTADLLEHLRERNRKVYSIAQFNIGGNTDFLALTDESRNRAKEGTKSSVVRDILGYDVPHYIRPTGFLEPLGDRKFVAMHIMFESFNGAVDEIIVNMRISDSPALAGYMVDLARLGKLAIELELYGTVYEVNAFYMKKPAPLGSRNVPRIVAYYKLLEFIREITERKEIIEEVSI
ncbi:MAG: myo-inositol-1-phosphate synthase [Thermoprotei archaeon]|nr:MAG: myo-inositol-1-phosphate synthase [Thermoprotei archaeon]